MGSSSQNSVVDENVKVWGTNNLFVIDASFVRLLSLSLLSFQLG
jgi:choline dehydrogenase-like flavoprotein